MASVGYSAVRAYALAAIAATVIGQGGARAAPLPAQACALVQIAIDTTGANDPVSPFDTRGYGEVILCRDTIVTSITYWQAPTIFAGEYYVRMYVTSVDSSGRPFNNVLYAGPVQQGITADPTHPSPITFVFEPPLVLPGPGKYFFDVKADDGLTCASQVWLLADTMDRYPDGMGWWTGKYCDPISPGSAGSVAPGFDMIFDIEFCDTHTTPVLRGSWGMLKAAYR